MEKQELETVTVRGGEMLKAEPVNYCGLQDFSMVTHFQNGLTFLLQEFVREQMADGVAWGEDSSVVTSVASLFDVLEDVADYRHNYLVRRIEQLEAANGLCHCMDIDIEQ